MIWRRFVDILFDNEPIETKTMPQLFEVVEKARQEWLSAQNYYNAVSDQDLVDHAVYMMQAAEKKYMYLLKKAREEDVHYSPYSHFEN
jgi:hypothetical protein